MFGDLYTLLIETADAYYLAHSQTGAFKDLCALSNIAVCPLSSMLAAAASVEAGPCEAPVPRDKVVVRQRTRAVRWTGCRSEGTWSFRWFID